ncbi:MAG: DUF1573 domain-containing protein [Planctomycetes bacterium]|nr:DUF1573 domain-containing protein [Planctomycetota bacterium]
MNIRSRLVVALASTLVGTPLVAQKPAAPSAPVEAPVKFVPGTPMPGTQGLRQGAAQPTRPGNAWFPVVDEDLGTVVGEDHVTAKFPFKNPTDQTVEWKNLQGSCQCSRAIIRVGERVYEHQSKPRPMLNRVTKTEGGAETREPVDQISIGPGESGEVEVHMEMHGVTGPRQATLDIHSTDEGTPHTKLKWNATGAKLLVVSPAEVNLNKMTWNESREFQVTVTSPLFKDFNILRMDEAPGFDVKWEKAMNGDQAVWTVKGKYGPLGEEQGSGGALKFYTDLSGEASFLVRVIAFVQGPLEVKPGGFLPMGRIAQGTEVVKDITFQPNDGQKLQATNFRLEKLSVDKQFVEVSQSMDGDNLVVHLHIKDGAPGGLLKGELVVELNHPVVKEKRILFNGYVR